MEAVKRIIQIGILIVGLPLYIILTFSNRLTMFNLHTTENSSMSAMHICGVMTMLSFLVELALLVLTHGFVTIILSLLLGCLVFFATPTLIRRHVRAFAP